MTNLSALRMHAGSCASHVRDLIHSAISEIEGHRATLSAKDTELATLRAQVEALEKEKASAAA